MNRTFAGSLAAIFALLGLAALRYRPPPPGPPALRARAAWQRALGEETPHPVGSAHDAEIRDRLVAQLRELGYRPEVIEGSSHDVRVLDCQAPVVQEHLDRIRDVGGRPFVECREHPGRFNQGEVRYPGAPIHKHIGGSSLFGIVTRDKAHENVGINCAHAVV